MTRTLFLIAGVFFLTTSVYAATATGSSQQKLDSLKDRLASAASQLSQSQKRALYGTVKTTSVSTITVETATKDVKIELTDAITVAQIIKGKRTALTTDDLSKGDVVTVFGDFDSTLDLLKAKALFIQGALPERVNGVISTIDKKNFTITITTPENKSIIVDIETTTKNIAWDKVNGTAKGAFSKYAVGDTVFVLETPEQKFANRVSAIRVLDITPIIASPSATAQTTPKPTP